MMRSVTSVSLSRNEPAKVLLLCALVGLVVYSPALWLIYQHRINASIVKASSQLDRFGPEGLFDAKQPGWHSANPASYPQSIQVDLRDARNIRSIGFLPQDGHPLRAPQAIRINTSDDGKTWTPIAGSDNICMEIAAGGWHDIQLKSSKKTRFLKIEIFSNCGDPELLTLRGLRIE